jgi:predicted dinucleotide-binding enzyme
VVVSDTSNCYPQQRDGRIAAIEDGMTESRRVEQQLGVSVFKPFNGIYAEHLPTRGVPAGTEGRIALPVAGHGADAARKALAQANPERAPDWRA